MIKEITIWEAEDGKRFDDWEAAQDYDIIHAAVSHLMSALGDEPKHLNGWYEGEWYVQHDPAVVELIRNRLQKIAQAVAKTNDPVWIIRYFETSHPVLCRAAYRLDCIDSDGCEWGQLYYRNHPPHTAKATTKS